MYNVCLYVIFCFWYSHTSCDMCIYVCASSAMYADYILRIVCEKSKSTHTNTHVHTYNNTTYTCINHLLAVRWEIDRLDYMSTYIHTYIHACIHHLLAVRWEIDRLDYMRTVKLVKLVPWERIPQLGREICSYIMYVCMYVCMCACSVCEIVKLVPWERIPQLDREVLDILCMHACMYICVVCVKSWSWSPESASHSLTEKY